MSDRVTVDEAARILGMSKQGVREHMKRNLFAIPIGEVTMITKGRYQYHIYRSMLEKHIGREISSSTAAERSGTGKYGE